MAYDANRCLTAGAHALHLHPRDAEGRERLDPEVVNHVVTVVRSACGLPVGVTTGEWLEPNLERRLSLISGWREPDYASVNVSESGSIAVMAACLDAGIGVEAGVWTVEDAEALVASDLAAQVTRILVEPVEVSADDAIPLVEDVHAILDWSGLSAPRLQHGDGEATWVLLRDAVRRGIDTRIGLEDTFYLPTGKPAAGNPELVQTAVGLGAGTPT